MKGHVVNILKFAGHIVSVATTSCCSMKQVVCCSAAKSCPTLCDAMDCSTPGFLSFTVSRSLFELMSNELVMTFNHLILCCHLLLLLSVFPRVFSNELALHNRWPKYCSFGFSISPSNEYSGLISSFALCFYFMSPLRNCDLLKGKDHSLCIFYNLYR